jgi:hypothetical protein
MTLFILPIKPDNFELVAYLNIGSLGSLNVLGVFTSNKPGS